MTQAISLSASQQEAIGLLTAAIEQQLQTDNDNASQLDALLWSTLELFQDYPFYTAKGLEFTYTIRGYEMFVSRKDKSITKSTVSLAFHTALSLRRAQLPISGPKKLKTFGASYLYPIFKLVGIIPVTQPS